MVGAFERIRDPRHVSRAHDVVITNEPCIEMVAVEERSVSRKAERERQAHEEEFLFHWVGFRAQPGCLATKNLFVTGASRRIPALRLICISL